MNKNLENVEMSGIRKFFNEVQKVEGAISLTLGQPDFNVPDVVKNGLLRAIKNNNTVYTENAGILPLRQEISKYLGRRNIKYGADEICITVGGSEALFSIFTALINAGDKVLIPDPAYPAYESIVKILGGEAVRYSLNEDFTINVEEIKKAVESGVKYLVLSLPSNPTGSILSKGERDELAAVIREHDVVVVTDEIYEALIYDEYYSAAEEEDILDKIIYVSGFSKMFSMTGLRVGYFAAKDSLMEQIMKVHQYNVSCAASICQYAVVEGLKNGLDDVEKMREIFAMRKNYVVNELRRMGLDVIEPKGAFYVFPSIKKFGMTSEEFCQKLLYDYKVACVPGSAFGKGGEGYIRISYCYSTEELKESLARMKAFIKTLN